MIFSKMPACACEPRYHCRAADEFAASERHIDIAYAQCIRRRRPARSASRQERCRNRHITICYLFSYRKSRSQRTYGRFATSYEIWLPPRVRKASPFRHRRAEIISLHDAQFFTFRAGDYLSPLTPPIISRYSIIGHFKKRGLMPADD